MFLGGELLMFHDVLMEMGSAAKNTIFCELR